MMKDLVAFAEPAVVMVVCHDINSKGSGFLISADGYVVTNNHVVSRWTLQNGVLGVSYSAAITVILHGVPHPAALAIDPADFRPVVYDYAILKMENLTALSYLQVGDTSMVRRGDAVVCLGFPLDFEVLVATDGIVSAALSRPSHVNTLFQIRTIVSDALIQYGNSGGPMLDVESGKVIGINTLGHELRDALTQRLKAWAIHSATAGVPALRDLIEYSLKWTYVGLNHAVSVEHVRGDTAWSAAMGGRP